MEFKFLASDRDNDFKAMRNKYFDSLPEPQELYLEIMAGDSRVHKILFNGKTAGYYMLNNKGELAEFFILPAYTTDALVIFETILKKHKTETIFCKTFDALLLGLCLDKKFNYTVDGFLFRQRITPVEAIRFPSIKVRPGEMEDIDGILAVDDGFFVSREEISTITANNNLVYFHENGLFAGCGIFQEIIPGRKVYDIGMMVHPHHRRKGIGTYIINYLTELCYSNGWWPVCGCSYKNLASKKTLEKAGYIACHRMLKFEVVFL